MTDLLTTVKQKAQQWLDSPIIDQETKSQVAELLHRADSRELIDNFYKDLEFGTGGLRGIMGAGTNCMNKYTVGVATQGLSNYLLKSFPGKQIKVAIAHDCRNNSRYFTEVAANVFSANGIEVYLFPDLRPTPILSYAIRYLGCDSGVVVTASHNPKEYNGYKAYWNDGAQVVPPHDKNIIAEVKAINGFDQVKFEGNQEKIHTIGPDIEEAYYKEVKKLIPLKEIVEQNKTIPIVYSSLHGSGITMVPECLERMGFTNVQLVEEQRAPDGNFPTVKSPNPEERSVMELAIQRGKAIGATLVMATDPDADRVGIGVRQPDGEFILLNGNQAFCLMMWFIMKNLTDKTNAYVVKTIVTSELVDTMARNYGIQCYNTLTGFKYIAELMRNLEGRKKFIAAGEESYGYMVGDFVRDKDAISACAFFAAMAACATDEGKSLYDWMITMYTEHAFYKEGLVNVTKKGQQGAQEIKTIMQRLRNNPPAAIAGITTVRLLDYKTLKETNRVSGETQPLSFPESDVLQFYLEDATKISVRPSGTEPKIKYYISVNTRLNSPEDYQVVNLQLDEQIKRIEQFLLNI